jgi:hypothetical protein
VNIQIKPNAGVDATWGFLSTQAKNVRLFPGPSSTCATHPWDAMILRDCHSNTDGFIGTEVGLKEGDILVMKMCEDYDCKCGAFQLLTSSKLI